MKLPRLIILSVWQAFSKLLSAGVLMSMGTSLAALNHFKRLACWRLVTSRYGLV